MRLFILILCGWAEALVARASDVEPLASLPRARVVLAEDARSVAVFQARPERVDELFQRGLLAWSGKPSLDLAWRSLLSPQDTIGVKVVSAPGATSGTRPAVAAAVVRSLLLAGMPPEKIVIWDKHLGRLRRAGYAQLARQLGVGLAGSADEGYDGDAFYDIELLGKLVWGDHDFGKNTENTGRRSYVSKLVTQRFTKIVNVTPLLNHNLAGVAGSLYTLAMDSVDNSLRFESSPTHLAQAVPEIYALESLGDKAVLHIVDALVCQYQGEERSLLHYSAMLGQIRFSTDPVALDMLSIQEIERQRDAVKLQAPKPNLQIYSNATLLELGIHDTKRIDLLRVN